MPNYVLYKKRYVILFLFTFAELCNTVVYATCNPIATEVNYDYVIRWELYIINQVMLSLCQPHCIYLCIQHSHSQPVI